ncbi:MAG: hypothetical protein ACLSEY_14690 [Enterocloster sp.]
MKDYPISQILTADAGFAFNDDTCAVWCISGLSAVQDRGQGASDRCGRVWKEKVQGLSLVDKGVLDATIQTPDFGGLSYGIAKKILAGKQGGERIYYPAGIDSSREERKGKSNCIDMKRV